MDPESGVERAGAGKNELLHKEDLSSARWDREEGASPRLRYAVFSAQRTGSELLCDYLRERGIGIPFEYFNHTYMHQIAGRLGCALPDRRINIVRYVSLLETKRTRNGVFGTKLQPDQLRTISVQDGAAARAWLSRFDRIVLLGRRDKLLQAISLTRAHLTDQWQLYGDDRQIPISCRDDVLFPMIADRLGKIREDEGYMMELTAGLDPRSVRPCWYEELSQPEALAATAEWLWTAAGHGKLPPEPQGGQRLPLKMDDSEARAIKARFLAAAGSAR